MITAYLIRTILVAGLIGLTASLVEFALETLGKPRRFVWVVALVLATIVPASGAFTLGRGGDSPSPLSTETAPAGGGAPSPAPDALETPAPSAGEVTAAPLHGARTAAGARLTVPAWLGDFDRPLAALWIGATLLWAAILAASAIRIRRSRAVWREAMLDGMPVYMSHDTGPALFGLTRFGIVVPSWVAELEPHRRKLIIAHEREHARAGDPVTLLAGALLVLVQPLNPAVWMMFRRLRLALEIDCDARVLAGSTDVHLYGNLLLDVGERTLTGAAPIATLSEGGSQLARRIAAMSRQPVPRAALRALAAVTAGAVLATIAWNLPHPELAEAHGAVEERTLAAPPPILPGRAIVRVHTVALRNAGEHPHILIWGVGGPVRVAFSDGELQPLTDTIRLDHLPAMRFDVTDGHAFVRLTEKGTMSLAADIGSGSARRVTAEAQQVVVLRGGRGLAGGDSIPAHVLERVEQEFRVVQNTVLRRLMDEALPGLLQQPVRGEEYIWLLVDAQDRVISANRGLPPGANGRITRMTTEMVRAMLPAMGPRLETGEGWGWSRVPTSTGDSINVIWARRIARGGRS